MTVRYNNDFKRIPSACVVTPAKAGVPDLLNNLDSGFRRNDGKDFLIKATQVKLPLGSARTQAPFRALFNGPFEGLTGYAPGFAGGHLTV